VKAFVKNLLRGFVLVFAALLTAKRLAETEQTK
jgi:hypothetical protein